MPQRLDAHEIVMGALLVVIVTLSVFKQQTSGIALAALITPNLLGRRIVRRHRGSAKRDILLLLTVLNLLFAALALAVTLRHEDDGWVTALLLGLLNAGFFGTDWHKSRQRHREAADVDRQQVSSRA